MLQGGIPKTKSEVRKFFADATGADEGGAPNGTGVSAASSNGVVKTVLTFVNTPLPLIDTAGVVARCALKIFDFPEGSVNIFGATVNLALTKSAAGVNADWDGDVSLGSVAAAGDATLTSTEANIVPSTSTPQAVAGATTAKALSTAGVVLVQLLVAVILLIHPSPRRARQPVHHL